MLTAYFFMICGTKTQKEGLHKFDKTAPVATETVNDRVVFLFYWFLSFCVREDKLRLRVLFFKLLWKQFY